MSLKVLTVDDSKTIRMIVKRAFDSYDCQLFEAENGVEGLATALREKPDLIVLDLTMPVMNGVEMLDRLKGDGGLKSVPVIMLTAESGKDNVMKIVKKGVRDYMVKPFKGEQLIERVKKVVTLEAKKGDQADEEDSRRYFSAEGDIQLLSLPDKISRPVTLKLSDALQTKMAEMVKAKVSKFILDLRQVTEINMMLIKMIVQVLQSCQKANFKVQVVGPAALDQGLKEFSETSTIKIIGTLEEAKTML
jgi:CheY-like chemotaxis protein/anti-anti-sigma regulatory factor